MYRAAVVFSGILALVLGMEPIPAIFKDNEHCSKWINSVGMRCCDFAMVPGSRVYQPSPEDIEQQKQQAEERKKCMELPSDPVTCERQHCIGVLEGSVYANGTLNKARVSEIQEKYFQGSNDIIVPIREKCIDGDLSNYGTNECDLMKFSYCSAIQVFRNCPYWRTVDKCEGVKEAAEECFKQFP